MFQKHCLDICKEKITFFSRKRKRNSPCFKIKSNLYHLKFQYRNPINTNYQNYLFSHIWQYKSVSSAVNIIGILCIFVASVTHRYVNSYEINDTIKKKTDCVIMARFLSGKKIIFHLSLFNSCSSLFNCRHCRK